MPTDAICDTEFPSSEKYRADFHAGFATRWTSLEFVNAPLTRQRVHDTRSLNVLPAMAEAVGRLVELTMDSAGVRLLVGRSWAQSSGEAASGACPRDRPPSHPQVDGTCQVTHSASNAGLCISLVNLRRGKRNAPRQRSHDIVRAARRSPLVGMLSVSDRGGMGPACTGGTPSAFEPSTMAHRHAA